MLAVASSATAGSSVSPASLISGIVNDTTAFSLPAGAPVADRFSTGRGTAVVRESVSTLMSRTNRWKEFFFDVARMAIYVFPVLAGAKANSIGMKVSVRISGEEYTLLIEAGSGV